MKKLNSTFYYSFEDSYRKAKLTIEYSALIHENDLQKYEQYFKKYEKRFIEQIDYKVYIYRFIYDLYPLVYSYHPQESSS